MTMLAATVLASAAVSARADQERDWMLELQDRGTFAMVDYFGTGGMLTLEHRAGLFGNSNDLTAGATVVTAYPLTEAAARMDLRILFLNIGGTLGYRGVWRDLRFAPGDDGSYCAQCERGDRRARDGLFERTPGSDLFPWAELRASLLFPFNEHFVMSSTGGLRYEDRGDRSYDWFYTSIYDRGILGRFETQMFVKHRDWGGIGPYLQLLVLPRAGEHELQLAVGFNAVTRLGLLPRNDLLFLTFLIRPGDPIYGQHAYFSPIRALLIYRMMFEL